MKILAMASTTIALNKLTMDVKELSSGFNIFTLQNGDRYKILKEQMELETYDIKQNRKSRSFEFKSIGPKGSIRKLVLYQETSIPNLFNLAFGDYNSQTCELDSFRQW